jgi:hypothetical protein
MHRVPRRHLLSSPSPPLRWCQPRRRCECLGSRAVEAAPSRSCGARRTPKDECHAMPHTHLTAGRYARRERKQNLLDATGERCRPLCASACEGMERSRWRVVRNNCTCVGRSVWTMRRESAAIMRRCAIARCCRRGEARVRRREVQSRCALRSVLLLLNDLGHRHVHCARRSDARAERGSVDERMHRGATRSAVTHRLPLPLPLPLLLAARSFAHQSPILPVRPICYCI